jgi:peptidyl-prolyl cis-trans isomerase SurA
MLIKKFIFSLLIFLLISIVSFSKESAYIIFKIDNDIITNIDIEKERRYLVALNPKLKDLDKNKLLEVAKESALRETIKKIELSKYFNFSSASMDTDKYIQNLYRNLNMKSDNEFKQYLVNNKLTMKYVEKKIQIEFFWNQLIFERYKNQINIDEAKLKNQLKKIDTKKERKLYFLSEIIFEKDNSSNLEEKISSINKSIKEIGFNNTANIYSLSDSSKFGGNVGWIEEEKLSKKITQQLKSLKAGEHTKPMQTGGAFLILKLEKIKYETKLIDKKKMLQRMIDFETSRQLEQFSKIFYKKIKINNNIDVL